MSVIVPYRKESGLEVFHNAYKLQDTLVELAANNFGLKPYIEPPKPPDYYNWSEGQCRGYDKCIERNKKRYEYYIVEFIPNKRNALLYTIDRVIEEMFLADCIYPIYEFELNERRIHQDLAIGYTESVIQQLQAIIRELPVDVEKYEPITKIIERQQHLIKKWRQSDKRFRDKFNQNELSHNKTGNT